VLRLPPTAWLLQVKRVVVVSTTKEITKDETSPPQQQGLNNNDKNEKQAVDGCFWGRHPLPKLGYPDGLQRRSQRGGGGGVVTSKRTNTKTNTTPTTTVTACTNSDKEGASFLGTPPATPKGKSRPCRLACYSGQATFLPSVNRANNDSTTTTNNNNTLTTTASPVPLQPAPPLLQPRRPPQPAQRSVRILSQAWSFEAMEEGLVSWPEQPQPEMFVHATTVSLAPPASPSGVHHHHSPAISSSPPSLPPPPPFQEPPQHQNQQNGTRSAMKALEQEEQQVDFTAIDVLDDTVPSLTQESQKVSSSLLPLRQDDDGRGESAPLSIVQSFQSPTAVAASASAVAQSSWPRPSSASPQSVSRPTPPPRPMAPEPPIHAAGPAPINRGYQGLESPHRPVGGSTFYPASPPPPIPTPPPPYIQHVRSDVSMVGSNAEQSLQRGIDFSELQIHPVCMAEGAFSKVHKAVWCGTPVAVKMLTTPRGYTSIQSKRVLLQEFIAEVNLLRGMGHPNIIRFMGVCREAAVPHDTRAIVTELVTNGSLWRALRWKYIKCPLYMPCDGLSQEPSWPLALYHPTNPQHGISPSHLPAPPLVASTITTIPPRGTWPWDLVKHVALGIARGMAYLHNGSPPILHRDLKVRFRFALFPVRKQNCSVEVLSHEISVHTIAVGQYTSGQHIQSHHL
jgi:hypothetical protein